MEKMIFKFSFSTIDGGFEEVEVSSSALAGVIGKKNERKLVGVQLLGPKEFDEKETK